MSHLTPEEEDILRHHPHPSDTDGIYAKRAPFTDGVNPVDNPAQKLTAAQAYIARLEAGLRLLGVDPSGDIKRQTDDITNRQMSDNDAAEHDLACALRERDAAQTRADTLRADLNGILSKLNIDPRLSPEMRTKAILQICEESNTLGLIAEHLGLYRLDPDAVRRRVQSDVVDLKVSHERVVKVEALLAEECSRGDNARHVLSVLGIIGDDLIGQAKSHIQHDTDNQKSREAMRAERDEAWSKLETLKRERHDESVRSGEKVQDLTRRAKELEAELLKARADKCLDVMDTSAGLVMLNVDAETAAKLKEEINNLSSAGIVVERATDPAHAELAQIWELWGAGRPMTPGCVYEAAQEMERANTKLQMKIGAATEHLDSAGIPKFYGHDQNPKGNPVPFEERVALLAEAYKDASWMRDKWHDGTQNAAAEIDDAHTELTSLGAPRRAGDLALSLAARTRALPDLLRP